MIKFTTRLALAICVSSLYSGQFVAFASDDEAQDMEPSSPPTQCFALTNTVAPVGSDSALLPAIPIRDMKNYMAGIMCDVVSPCRLAQLSKTWHKFVLGRTLQAKAKEKIMAIPFSPNSPSARWLEMRDLQILNSGAFRYQRKGGAPIDVELSTMAETNGVLVLPAELAYLRLCVMRDPKTFVNPEGKNLRRTLVLLLTLSELKRVARELPVDASFLEDVARADLSQNAVCALIRYGGDDIADCGFRCTILSYHEMSGLSVQQLYRHEKAVFARASRSGLIHAHGLSVFYGCCIFKLKLDL